MPQPTDKQQQNNKKKQSKIPVNGLKNIVKYQKKPPKFSRQSSLIVAYSILTENAVRWH